MRRICVTLTTVFCILLLIAPMRAAGWTATATTLDLTAGPGAKAAYLAPDGSRFAYVNRDELCLYSLSGEKGNCVTLDSHSNMDLETVRWSPDSKKLAFSEDFLISFRDSDIWLYDTETNTVKDMTPAPNRELNFIANNKSTVIFTVDLVPQWSPDSQFIYFIRYTFNRPATARAKFFKVSITDGTTEEVAAVKTNFAISTYAFALSPDGSQIAHNVYSLDSSKDSTWYLDLTTQDDKFAAAAIEGTAPWAYQYSPDGNYVLSIGIDNKGGGLGIRKPETSAIYTLPVSGGRQQQLNTESYVFAAGWGQTGSDLAYTTFDQLNPDKEGLYITSAPGQAGELVLPGRFIAPTPRVRIPINWAANNTVLLSQAPDFKLVVVQLSQS